MTHGYPNEGTQAEKKSVYPYMSKVVYRRGTWGTETSKYPQEKKVKTIPKVVASEIGRAQTKSRNTLGVRIINKADL